MALTKEIIIDKISIVGEYKKLNIREAIIVYEDGVELAKSFHRRVIASNYPSASLAAEDSEIQNIAATVWTDDVKSSYQTFLSSSAD